MSGGRFGYNQTRIWEMGEELESIIEKNGKEKTRKYISVHEPWNTPDYYEKYPEERYYYLYPPEVIKKFKEGVEILNKAFIYVQRIDWLLSGDDGEENFLIRLENDLKELDRERGNVEPD